MGEVGVVGYWVGGWLRGCWMARGVLGAGCCLGPLYALVRRPSWVTNINDMWLKMDKVHF